MLKFIPLSDGFEVLYKGHPVIRHSDKKPFLFIGRGEGSFRMKHASFKIKKKIFEKVALKDFTVKNQDQELLEIEFGSLLMVKVSVSEHGLKMGFSCSDKSYNRLWISLPADKNEHIYGCGEQYSALDLRGKKVPIWVEEQGIGRGYDLISLLTSFVGARGDWYTTYFPQPTFISSANYFCHLETFSYSTFDFTSKTNHMIEVWEIPPKLIIETAKNAPEVIEKLSAFLGRQKALPQWVFDGVWLGIKGGRETVSEKMNKALDAGVKVSALWCEDWVGTRKVQIGFALLWDWKYNEDYYPDLPGFIKELNDKGIRFLGYVNPMIIPGSDLYDEAKSKGYLVKRSNGEVYDFVASMFPVGIFDLSNPEARQWIKERIIKKNMIDIGMSGWMADFGEALPVDGILYSDEPGEKLHNRYPVLWAQVNAEAVEEAGKDDEIVYFSRSGFTGSSKYTKMIWAGDQFPNWSFDDGLATVIPAGISMGMSGIGLHHSDIGGFTTIFWIKRTPELMMRWTEHSAFTLLMRTHEGNHPEKNIHFFSSPEVLEHFARFSRIYTHLKPYHLHLVKEYTEKGLPAMRHPYIHYEKEEELHKLKYQYLYGRDLMVAPVVRRNCPVWRLYLPDDRWIHLWSGESYGKGWHTVKAPVGEPPVFYRKESQFAKLFEDTARL